MDGRNVKIGLKIWILNLQLTNKCKNTIKNKGNAALLNNRNPGRFDDSDEGMGWGCLPASSYPDLSEISFVTKTHIGSHPRPQTCYQHVCIVLLMRLQWCS